MPPELGNIGCKHSYLPCPPPMPGSRRRRPGALDRVRERVPQCHYSLRTERACVHRSRALDRFHGLRHPRDMGRAEVESFLRWPATERHAFVATRRQALSALPGVCTRVSTPGRLPPADDDRRRSCR